MSGREEFDEAILRRELPDDLARGLEDFDNFSLAGSTPETPLCLLLDANAGKPCAKYDAARCGEDAMGRLPDSLAILLAAVARGEDDADAPYDDGETLIDRIDRAAERFPDSVAVI